VTDQGAICDVASIHFGLTIRRTNILVCYVNVDILSLIKLLSAVWQWSEI